MSACSALLKDQSSVIEEIAADLNSNFNLDYICYSRCHQDKWLYISSNHEFSQAIIHDDKYLPAPAVIRENAVVRWSHFMNSALLQKVKQTYSYDASVIVSCYEQFSDSFTLASSYDPEAHYPLLYSSKLRLDLTLYLREMMSDLISSGAGTLMSYPQSYRLGELSVVDHREFHVPHYEKAVIMGYRGEVKLSKSDLYYFKSVLYLKTAKEIAFECGVCKKTVEYHLANLKDKLGVTKRSDFYRIAKMNNLLNS